MLSNYMFYIQFKTLNVCLTVFVKVNLYEFKVVFVNS